MIIEKEEIQSEIIRLDFLFFYYHYFACLGFLGGS